MSGGFLSRWARLKAETQATEPQVPDEVVVEQAALPVVPEDVAPGEDVEPEEPPFDSADLPDVDSLTAESDYSMFMDARVPEDLRNKALRKLWTSDPVYAVRDGLNDYDEDYRTASLVGSAVRTIYDAVRGYAPPDPEEGAESGVEDEGPPAHSQVQVEEVGARDDGKAVSENADGDSKNA